MHIEFITENKYTVNYLVSIEDRTHLEAAALDGGRDLEAGDEETLPGVKVRPEGGGQGRVHRLGPVCGGGLELVKHGALTYSETCHRKGHLKALHHH